MPKQKNSEPEQISKNRFDKLKKYFLDGYFPYLWIAIVSILLYLPTIYYNFTTFDDQNIIVDKFYFFKDISNFFRLFNLDIFLTSNRFYYRPVMTASYMLNTILTGQDPMGFHIVNVLLHASCAVLIFYVLRKFNFGKGISFFFTLIFAVHPVSVQAVAWISGRTDTLWALLLLVAFISFIKLVEENNLSSLKKTLLFAVHFIFYLLSLFMKESSLVFPFLAIYYYYFIQEQKLFTTKSRIFIGSWVIGAAFYYIMRSSVAVTNVESIFARLLSVPEIIQAFLIYIGKIFIPIRLSPWEYIPDSTIIYGIISLVIILIVLITGKIKNKSVFWFGVIWYAFLLFPTFFQTTKFSALFENRIYLSLFGIIIILLEIKLPSWLRIKKSFAVILGIIILGLFTYKSIVYSSIFENSRTVWKYAVKTSPSSPIVRKNMGNVFMKSGQFSEAATEFEKAVSLDPDYEDALLSLGNVYYKTGNLLQAEKYYRKGIKVNRYNKVLHNNLGNVYYKTRKPDSAAVEYEIAVRIDSSYFEAFTGMGLAYAQMQQLELAKNAWEKALNINPGYPLANYNLGLYYGLKKEFKNAVRYLEVAKRNGYPVNPNLLSNYREKIKK